MALLLTYGDNDFASNSSRYVIMEYTQGISHIALGASTFLTPPIGKGYRIGFSTLARELS